MRKPKIGDIILCNFRNSKGEERPHPAIVLFCETNSFAVQVFGSCASIIHLQYSYQQWSWPDEEKQESEGEKYVRDLNEMRWGNVKEEKPKECEHKFTGFNLNNNHVVCEKCGYESEMQCEHTFTGAQYTDKPAELICKRCGFSKPWDHHGPISDLAAHRNEATEVIYKIWKISQAWRNESPPNVRNDVSRLMEMYELIKEYKGIK